MLRKILIFIPMLFCLIMGSLAFLSPDIIGGILASQPIMQPAEELFPVILEPCSLRAAALHRLLCLEINRTYFGFPFRYLV